MASFTSTSTGSLAVTLAHAITYLTRSLITRYSATTIIKLQLSLEANLTSLFTPSWVPSEPLRGSGRRCLTLSPYTAPPRAIYNSCKAAGIEWSQWIALLGGVEFDFFVDPGCVSVRFGSWDSGKVTKFLTIWSEEGVRVQKQSIPERQVQAELRAQAQARALAAQIQNPNKTVAQQLMIDDHEEDELFAMIADEVREPTWLTPILSQFPTIPAPPRSTNSSPVSILSATSTHSRSSSRSSNSSSGFSSPSSVDSYGSATTVSLSSPDSEKSAHKLSRRERARQARVFIDASKNEVTNYDGGKTTVLTGGVMLGAVAPKPKAVAGIAVPTHRKTGSSSSTNWRSSRA